MHHKGKKGNVNPDPQNQLELKDNASIHWTTSVNADYSGLKEVYIYSFPVVIDSFQGWLFRFFFNLFPCRIKSWTDQS